MSLKTLQQWELKCEDHRCECEGCHVLKQIHFHASKRKHLPLKTAIKNVPSKPTSGYLIICATACFSV